MMHQYGFAFENPPDSSIVLANLKKRKRSPRKLKAESDAYDRQIQILFELDDVEPALDDNWDEESVDQIRCYLLKKTLALFADGRVAKSTKEEALDWLMSDSVGPFTFLTCCYAEGVEPEAVRNLTLLVKRKTEKGA
tara:strand:- start:19421 stop:19831 length:411 start_codon:yes stop_codon:yes gene_type:complete